MVHITTTLAGGKITGLLALTMIGSEALAVGDWVQVSGDYEVEKADGTKAVLGRVSVANVRRVNVSGVSTTFPSPNVGGDVTVEAMGFFVARVTLGATVAAGDGVSVAAAAGAGAEGDVVGAGASTSRIGIALMGGDATDDIDILVTGGLVTGA